MRSSIKASIRKSNGGAYGVNTSFCSKRLMDFYFLECIYIVSVVNGTASEMLRKSIEDIYNSEMDHPTFSNSSLRAIIPDVVCLESRNFSIGSSSPWNRCQHGRNGERLMEVHKL